MRTCPKGNDINLCRNRDMYKDEANSDINALYYEETFCPSCELIGPLNSATSCFICNDELDNNVDVDEEFDKFKYHRNCYYFSMAKIE